MALPAEANASGTLVRKGGVVAVLARQFPRLTKIMIAELGRASDHCRMSGRDGERVIVDDCVRRIGWLERLDLRLRDPGNFDAAFLA